MAMEQSDGKKRLVLKKIASVARSRQRQKPDKVGYHFNRPTCLRPSINHRVSILFFSSSVSSGSTQTLLLFFLPDDTPIPAPAPSSLASLRSPRPRPLLFARHQPPTSHHRPPTHLAIPREPIRRVFLLTPTTMSGEAWLYLFAVLINAVNLFLQVFFTIMYSDLEWYAHMLPAALLC
jgi:hypothetical protein